MPSFKFGNITGPRKIVSKESANKKTENLEEKKKDLKTKIQEEKIRYADLDREYERIDDSGVSTTKLGEEMEDTKKTIDKLEKELEEVNKKLEK